LAVLAACGSDAVFGDKAVLTGSVHVSCSKDCKDHGSCGTAEDTGEKVVFLGDQAAFPSASAAEFRGLVNGTAVEIVETKIVPGIVQDTWEEVEIRFYLVEQPLAELTGWVPGFCIANIEE
jgi:hypothetical protein